MAKKRAARRSSDSAAIDLAERTPLPPSFTLLIEIDQFIRRCRPVSSCERRIETTFD